LSHKIDLQYFDIFCAINATSIVLLQLT